MNPSFNSGARETRELTPEILPNSQYLHDRLQQRRARNTRPKKLRQSDFGPRRGCDDDIFLAEAEESKAAALAARLYDSSPLGGVGTNKVADGSSQNMRRSIGVRDMDERMDRLTKENFALKLELDRRREHTNKLQEQIDAMREATERAEQLHDEHAELLKINSQLVDELEKRDKAVEEAVDIIRDLEDQVEDLAERHSHTRPSTANADSGYAGTETHEQPPPSSPPEVSRTPKTTAVASRPPPPAASAAAGRLFNAVNSHTPARQKREPSILSQKKPSTQALRSVYLETSKALYPVKSFHSLLSKRESTVEDDEEEALNSPRLSVLSESSFPSLYSPQKHVSPDRHDWEGEDDGEGPRAHLRQDSIKRVSQWMNCRDQLDETPSKKHNLPDITSPLARMRIEPPSSPSVRVQNGSYYTPLVEKLSPAAEVMTTSAERRFQPRDNLHSDQSSRRKQSHTPASFAGPIFGEPLLPPTPDSASTRMLRTSRSSLADEKSLLDTTPIPVKGYSALQPELRTAPKQLRSSVELREAADSYFQRRDDLLWPKEGMTRDSGPDYDGFPDGNSILFGTPSRFLDRGKPPATATDTDTVLNGDETPTWGPASHPGPPRRRLSSSEATLSPRKPSLNRAETSPTFLGQMAQAVASGRPTASPATGSSSITSPRSYHSGSSSNRTVIRPSPHSPQLIRMASDPSTRTSSSQHQSSFSPTTTSAQSGQRPVSRASASPARTLSQKTQRLFRRMSSSNRDTNHPPLTASTAALPSRPENLREKSPLPTLTSTPSSAYLSTVSKESRRLGTTTTITSASTVFDAVANPLGSHPPSIRRPLTPQDTSTRPGIHARTMTEPPARRASVVGTSSQHTPQAFVANATAPLVDHAVTTPNQRKGAFKRSTSVRTKGAKEGSPAPPVSFPSHYPFPAPSSHPHGSANMVMGNSTFVDAPLAASWNGGGGGSAGAGFGTKRRSSFREAVASVTSAAVSMGARKGRAG